MQPYRVWAEIDLCKLKHNLQEIRRFLNPGTKILSVLKADAYGHGAVVIAKYLKKQIDYIGVGDSQEALELRQAGIEIPILILGTIVEGEMSQVVKSDITVAVHTLEQVVMLNEEARKQNKKVKIHLFVDTGMTRLGVSHTQFAAVLKTVKNCNHLIFEGIASHFSSASEKNPVFSYSQMDRFMWVLNHTARENLKPELVHLANSAGSLNYPASQISMVRPGLSLFGINPGYQSADHPQLEPILSLYSQIAFIRKSVGEGTPISYDRNYYTSCPTDIATIPVGYNDGYRRLFANQALHGKTAEVIIQGIPAPVAGKITMDYTMIDVGHIPEVHVGDKVTLIGKHGDYEITVENLAEKALTIPYDIFCGLSRRVVRLYRIEEDGEFLHADKVIEKMNKVAVT